MKYVPQRESKLRPYSVLTHVPYHCQSVDVPETTQTRHQVHEGLQTGNEFLDQRRMWKNVLSEKNM